jgi:hypothetical protein
MQVPKNSRDLKLQNTSPRVLDIKSNYINLSCPTLQFKYGSDNVAQPASTIVTATLVGILQGIVTFTVTGLDPVPTTTNNQIAINPDDIVGDLVSVTASLVYQGITYTAVPITISKIFNQLVVKTSRSIDLLPSYTNGSGYTLPAADNFIELYNGTTKLDSDVEYGPATQTKNGLTATVNTSTGKITLSETAANNWTGTTDNFVFTAKRGSITYSTTYTITKAKQGVGGQQLAEVSLYQWATTQPAVPTGTGTYAWATLTHTYIPTVVNPDSWTTAVPANPGTVGIKLWKITKGVSAEASSTNTTAAIVWNSGYVITVVSTTSNSTIKTTQVIVYKNDISIPTISGTSTYTWSSQLITANIPNGWTATAPTPQQGFTLYAATVSITERVTEGSTSVNWSEASVNPARYYGTDGATGINAITVDLTNGSHAIPTDSTGDTVNYANSGTDLFVYEGATALGFLTAAAYDAAVIANTANGKYKVTSSSSTVTAGALAAVTVDSVVGGRFADLTASSFAKTSTGSLVITVTGKRSNGASFTYLVTQTFSKTPSGIQGVAGVAYWLTTSSSVIQKNIASAYSPTTITVSGKQSSGSTVSNYSGYFKIFLNGSATATYTSEAAEATKTYTIVADTATVTIKLYTSSDFSVLLDEETVPVVSDGATGAAGANAITADLTNGSHAIPTDSTGDTVNYANSGTDLFVYEGATALGFLTVAAYDAAVIANTANGKYKVTSSSSTVTAGALAAVTVDSVVGARFADLTASSFAKTSTGSLVITVTGKRVSGTSFSYILTQTFSKTPSGIQGVAGVAYWLTTSSSVIKKNIASVYSPTTITVTGKQSSGSTVSNYSGYFKIFLNGSGTATYTSETAEAIKTYTIVADTTTISVKLYTSSDFSVLLDEETIPVVSDGATGSTGASARRAYVVATGTPSGTPIIFTATGDKLPISDDAVPVSTWFVGKTWLSAAPSTALVAGETLYQSDGVYVTGGNTVWGYPYISALKVGSLSAITVNTGGLTVSDYIKSGATNLTEGTGFYLNSSGYLRVGTAGGARVQYDSDGLSIYNASNTAILTTGGTLLWGAVGGSGRPADSATVGAIVGNNVYDSQSVVASLGRIFNNLLDPGKWTISSGSQPGFNQNGTTAENQVIAALAPDGAPSLIWKSVSTGNVDADGGWNTDNFVFDHAKPYRFTTWIRMSGNTTGSVYLGVGAGTVKNLSDSAINNNPYFFGVPRNGFSPNRWYLFVGYVWPSSFTGTDVAASKIYDSVTGEAITTGTDFKWDSANTLTTHRAYQYYTSVGAVQEFWSPRVDIIDGSETPITTLLAIAKSGLAASSASQSATLAGSSASSSATSALASASSATAANDALQLVGGISWLGDATIRLLSGVRIIKDGTGATAGWNAHRYSVESYTGGAYISFQPASTSDFMIGLNTDPATNSSYTGLDYAWYCLADGTLWTFESNVGTNLGVTYDSNTVLSITYDNQFIRYFRNGVIVRTIDTGSGSNLRFYIDSSLHSVNSEIKSIRFGPNAAKGAVAGNLSITGNGTFRRTENLVISPSVMYLSATTQNFTSITSYTWKVNGAAITSSNSASTASGNTLTVSSADFTNNINRVYSVDVLGVLNGVDTTLTDSVTINRLDNGSSAITVDCSNENITFTSTASTGFTGITFTGGSSIFSVYKGSTQIEYGTGNNQWRMGTPEYTGIGYSVSGITIGNTWVQVAPNSMTQNNAYSTYSIIYKDPNGVETTYTKVITYSLARTGAASTVAGPRGSLHLYLSGYTVWDSTTKGAVNNTFTNVYGGKVINDMVTVYGTNFSQTRIYTGNTATGDEGWVTITVAIDGNLLVSGTVNAGAISTTNAFIGHKLQDADGLFVLDFYNKTLSITTT